ncbi:MAG: ABC transporter substrate-binding protein [Saprospiraceae bacterium]|nr:ABC transporter substrate-binding protein [Saprospiraceae bacterium]
MREQNEQPTTNNEQPTTNNEQPTTNNRNNPSILSTIDQLNREVHIPFPPKRIVSLVPSQTELLFDLGLREEVVGITKFCVHPEQWFRQKKRVGGTKNLNIEAIAALQPDLLIGNKEENERWQIEALEALYPVWMSDVQNLEEAEEMIRRIGELVGKLPEAEKLVSEIRQSFESLEPPAAFRTAYFIWREPYMVAAAETFINDLLVRAGFSNVFGNLKRYPEVDMAMIRDAAPEVILLSSEPYPFQEKHVEELRNHCPNAAICLADGELFSWYGSRLTRSATYFRNLHHKLAVELASGIEFDKL